MFNDSLAFLNAHKTFIPASRVVKTAQEIFDHAVISKECVSVAGANIVASDLLAQHVDEDKTESLYTLVFQGAPDHIIGHALTKLIADARAVVLATYKISEAE